MMLSWEHTISVLLRKKDSQITGLRMVLLFVVFLAVSLSVLCTLPNGQINLEQGFVAPPRSARPRVMWWWLNSNISREGITRDLEEMKRQGIGGALIFDASPVDRWQRLTVNPVPVGPAFMSPEWRALFRHAVQEAGRLGIELGVSLTSGFNAGGPWVTPEYGQQELVWSELRLKGGDRFTGELPLPSGPIYGNRGELLQYNEMLVNNDLAMDEKGQPVHYRDVAVLAMEMSSTNSVNQDRNIRQDAVPGRLKHWPLKSVHSFDYPEKNGFLFGKNYEMVPDSPGESRVMSRSVIDLTDRLDSEGRLDWTPPKGDWLILRFGHTHTGIMLQATNPQNRGLAMNHLSGEAAARHFAEIAEKMADDIEAVDGKSLVYFYLDSWEVRIANWTPGFREEFSRRRGYDMTKFLPVLAGQIVDSREISNRFLHDYRQTIGDCIADNYYGKFQELCHSRGFQFRAEMATTPIPADMLKCLGRCDVPFGEFWAESSTGAGRVEVWERMFGKQASSAAHIYGNRLAAAEALTVIDNHWEYGPFQLKRTVDQAFCSGLNSLMIHTFTHSPPDVPPPGYEYFAGTHFNPQITWWEQARSFTDYIGRCQFMLQQGRFVADACLYQGDRNPVFVSNKQIDPRLGPGYDYDVVNSEVILNRMSVRNGWIVLPDGMRYRLLVLPDETRINPGVLDKIHELVRAGATVIGPRPETAYGLRDYPDCDAYILDLSNRLWRENSSGKSNENRIGKGRIVWGRTPRDLLLEDGILPDFEFRSSSSNPKLDWIHRTIDDASDGTDLYFVANLKERREYVECTFRVRDKIPEIWDPDTGEICMVAVYDEQEGRITVPLRLPPLGSVFVVFRKTGHAKHFTSIVKDTGSMDGTPKHKEDEFPEAEVLIDDSGQLTIQVWKPGDYRIKEKGGCTFHVTVDSIPSPVPVEGPWTVHFPQNGTVRDSVCFRDLISWTESREPSIRYFSGTAVYRTTFRIENDLVDRKRGYFLDLGKVKEMAEISLNGEDLGVLWKPPFRMDVSAVIRPGKNTLIVHITNLWPNRLIGDQFLPEAERFTFTNIGKFTKESPLMESGLLGPVKLHICEKRIIDLQD